MASSHLPPPDDTPWVQGAKQTYAITLFAFSASWAVGKASLSRQPAQSRPVTMQHFTRKSAPLSALSHEPQTSNDRPVTPRHPRAPSQAPAAPHDADQSERLLSRHAQALQRKIREQHRERLLDKLSDQTSLRNLERATSAADRRKRLAIEVDRKSLALLERATTRLLRLRMHASTSVVGPASPEGSPSESWHSSEFFNDVPASPAPPFTPQRPVQPARRPQKKAASDKPRTRSRSRGDDQRSDLTGSALFYRELSSPGNRLRSSKPGDLLALLERRKCVCPEGAKVQEWLQNETDEAMSPNVSVSPENHSLTSPGDLTLTSDEGFESSEKKTIREHPTSDGNPVQEQQHSPLVSKGQARNEKSSPPSPRESKADENHLFTPPVPKRSDEDLQMAQYSGIKESPASSKNSSILNFLGGLELFNPRKRTQPAPRMSTNAMKKSESKKQISSMAEQPAVERPAGEGSGSLEVKRCTVLEIVEGEDDAGEWVDVFDSPISPSSDEVSSLLRSRRLLG